MGKNVLLVEGKDDLHAVQELMSKYVTWGESKQDRPVDIRDQKGATELLKPDSITAHLKESDLDVLGVIIDADVDFSSRWQQLQDRCAEFFDSFPSEIPSGGLIHVEDGRPRFGAWIMPDNVSKGTLETFLGLLVPANPPELWKFSGEVVTKAKAMEAPFLQVHRDKARMHSWLSWQDPPGRPFGIAFKANFLDPKLPAGKEFAKWFIDLFQLPLSDGNPPATD